MQNTPAIAAEWVVVLFIAALAIIMLIKIWSGSIDLNGLLSEPPTAAPGGGTPALPGKASLSRLQLLLFTFVIAGLYLTLCLEAGALIDIPNQVLGLLGISGGSYVISKGIQLNR
jgi:hypothetical protein